VATFDGLTRQVESDQYSAHARPFAASALLEFIDFSVGEGENEIKKKSNFWAIHRLAWGARELNVSMFIQIESISLPSTTPFCAMFANSQEEKER
jgi:hypothetical protein